MITKSGSAVWKGGLQDGAGTVSTQTGVLSDQPYSFATRFEGQSGTNPEELLGAAHASCFAMALSMILGQHGMTADAIDATSSVSLEQVEGGFSITKVHLDVTATIPGADPAKFAEAAAAAKDGCPVSKLYKAEISMDARLA
ncbi:MAG: OsmC family protein [Pseudomonadota bacterium]